MRGIGLVEILIALAVSSLLLVVLTQLLTTTIRQESRLLTRYRMNQSARDVIAQVEAIVRWADDVQVTMDGNPTTGEGNGFIATYYEEDGATVKDQYEFQWYPGSGELVATQNGSDISTLTDRILMTDFVVTNVANPDSSDYEYKPLVQVSMNLESAVDQTVSSEHDTLVANLESNFEIVPPTPTPTPTPVATNTPTPGPTNTSTPTINVFAPTATPTDAPVPSLPQANPPTPTNTPKPTATPQHPHAHIYPPTPTPTPVANHPTLGGAKLVATNTPRPTATNKPRPTHTPTIAYIPSPQPTSNAGGPIIGARAPINTPQPTSSTSNTGPIRGGSVGSLSNQGGAILPQPTSSNTGGGITGGSVGSTPLNPWGFIIGVIGGGL